MISGRWTVDRNITNTAKGVKQDLDSLRQLTAKWFPDGIGDKSTYFLGGAPNCGKGQPEQSAPVSHGAVPARFRQVNVLNTERRDVA